MGNGDFQWESSFGISSGSTASAYTKLDEYVGNLQKSEIEALQNQGDFCGNLAVRQVAKSKNRRLMSKMGKPEAIISDMEDAISKFTIARGEYDFWMFRKRKRF